MNKKIEWFVKGTGSTGYGDWHDQIKVIMGKGTGEYLYIMPAALNGIGNPAFVRVGKNGSWIYLSPAIDKNTGYQVQRFANGNSPYIAISAFARKNSIRPGMYVAVIEDGCIVFNSVQKNG